jgi:hypothetical protein
MALSKAQLAELAEWRKNPEASPPDFLEKGLFFDNDDHFKRVVDSKLAPETKKAREKLQAELLDALGITDPEELGSVKQKLAEAAGTVTEVEKLRADNAKLTKELTKVGEKFKDLEGFKVQVLKGRAIDPLLVKIDEKLRPAARRLIEIDLRVDGDKIVGPEGAEVSKFVDEFLESNPAFKAAETKSGAGTGPNGGKSKQQTEGSHNNGTQGGGNGGTPPNGSSQPLQLGSLVSSVLREKAEGQAQ